MYYLLVYMHSLLCIIYCLCTHYCVLSIVYALTICVLSICTANYSTDRPGECIHLWLDGESIQHTNWALSEQFRIQRKQWCGVWGWGWVGMYVCVCGVHGSSSFELLQCSPPALISLTFLIMNHWQHFFTSATNETFDIIELAGGRMVRKYSKRCTS